MLAANALGVQRLRLERRKIRVAPRVRPERDAGHSGDAGQFAFRRAAHVRRQAGIAADLKRPQDDVAVPSPCIERPAAERRIQRAAP